VWEYWYVLVCEDEFGWLVGVFEYGLLVGVGFVGVCGVYDV